MTEQPPDENKPEPSVPEQLASIKGGVNLTILLLLALLVNSCKGGGQGYDRDMAELQLAHDVGTQVERAYRRTDMVERRRVMMEAWARYLTEYHRV